MSRSLAAGCSPPGDRRNESLSPPLHRPRHRDGGWQVIIEWVVKSTTGIIYPMLMPTNYTEWSLVMCVNLQAIGLWDAIWYDVVEYRDNKHALAALLRVVPVDI
jgi:hypothetical protein